MRAIGYVRVSTEEQAAEGLSMAAQADRLADYCRARGWTLAALYRDAGVSGRTLERPGIQAALEALEAGEADVLLALKLDRLTRSVVGLHELIERCDKAGARLAAVQDALDTGTANGRMVTSILAVLAEWEREVISERTKAALAYKKARGEWVGVPPYGFAVNGDGTLHVVGEEMSTIATMKRWRRRGASYRQIAARLNDACVPARRGTWGKSSVARLVNEHTKTRKARYIGA